jgi:hypothetical protein
MWHEKLVPTIIFPDVFLNTGHIVELWKPFQQCRYWYPVSHNCNRVGGHFDRERFFAGSFESSPSIQFVVNDIVPLRIIARPTCSAMHRDGSPLGNAPTAAPGGSSQLTSIFAWRFLSDSVSAWMFASDSLLRVFTSESTLVWSSRGSPGLGQWGRSLKVSLSDAQVSNTTGEGLSSFWCVQKPVGQFWDKVFQ